MDRVYLPPIQDILYRPLHLTKTDKNNNRLDEGFQPPISPVSPTSSSLSSHLGHLNPPILNEDGGPRLNKEHVPSYYDSGTLITNLTNREDNTSADRGFKSNGYTNCTEMDSRYNSQKYDDEPLHQQRKQIKQHRLPHSRSYSDHFMQENSRRSSASEDISERYIVDPPRETHRRATSDIPLNRYRCNECQKTFSRPSSLRIHILSHTGEKPHVCPQPGCGRRFSVQSNMRRHLKVHYCNSQQQRHPQQQQQFQHQTFTRHLE